MLRHMRPFLQAALDSARIFVDGFGLRRGSIDGDCDGRLAAIAAGFGPGD